MTMGITEDEVDLRNLGICPRCYRHIEDADPSYHAPECEFAGGLNTARGDEVIDGEVCSGPCHLPLSRGERYVPTGEGAWCLACAALAGKTPP